MDEFEQQEAQREMQERITNIRKTQQAAAIAAQQDALAHQSRSTDRIFTKAMKKYGLSPEEFQRALREDPGATMEVFEDHIKSYVKSISKNRTRYKEPKARPVSTRAPRQTESRSRGGDFEELKQKAQRGQASDDELIGYLSKLL